VSAINRIGLLDWGIGGLSVYKEIQSKIGVSCLYFSDSGYTPYGKIPKKELIQRLNLIIDFFRKENISYIIIACNAASTVLDQVQIQNKDIQLFGMLKAGETSIRKSRKKKILVLGGKRTIKSCFFQNAFRHSDIHLEARVAQPLSAFIERGEQNSIQFTEALKAIQKKVRISPTFVLLACTHYPAATKTFQNFFPQARIVDPAEILVNDLSKILGQKLQKQKSSIFVTTGSSKQSKLSAEKAFNITISEFKKV